MNNVEKMLAKYGNLPFVSSSVETPEFYILSKRLKATMQKDIEENFPNLEISVWSKGHFYISGFITRKNDGAIFYFNISDVRCWNVATSLILYRSARHLKDYFGGMNLYCRACELLEKINKESYEFVK